MVQRIMNTVEKTSTGVTSVQLILNNSISLFKANTHVTAGVAHTGHDKTQGSNRMLEFLRDKEGGSTKITT